MTRNNKGIFISYRRAENAAHAGWLGEHLSEHFVSHDVFRDIDSIQPGLDFVEAIERALDSCEVLIAMVGANWLTFPDATGQPRLQHSDDYVRLEIATALKRNVRVIPVLVEEAKMPPENELPKDLATLARRNAFELRDTRWRDDVKSLIDSLENVIGSRKEDAGPTAKADEYYPDGGEDGGTHPTDTIGNGDVGELPSSRWRIPEWLKTQRLAAIAIASSLTAIALIIGYFVINHSQETAAIATLLTNHYEKAGVENYEAAFADFSKFEQDRQGGLKGYIESNKTWCHDVGADVREPEVRAVNGDKATAAVSVVYQTTCGNSPHRFDTEILYSWSLLKEQGDWKLDSRDEERLLYSRVPIEIENEGPMVSDFTGSDDHGNLDSVRASNTADSAQDGCKNTIEYEPAHIVDGKRDTAWQVGGTGIGQWIELHYKEPVKVSQVGIIPGYDKTDPCEETERFYQMYVVRRAQITFDDGSSVEMNFERKPEMQFKNLHGHETTSLRITILDTYPPSDKPPDGSPYDYTLGKAAISEVKVDPATTGTLRR